MALIFDKFSAVCRALFSLKLIAPNCLVVPLMIIGLALLNAQPATKSLITPTMWSWALSLYINWPTGCFKPIRAAAAWVSSTAAVSVG